MKNLIDSLKKIIFLKKIIKILSELIILPFVIVLMVVISYIIISIIYQNTDLLISVLIGIFINLFLYSCVHFPSKYLEKKECQIKPICNQIDLSKIEVKLSKEILEYILMHKDISDIADNINSFEGKLGSKDWLSTLLEKRENKLEILNNQKLIDYINELTEDNKIKFLSNIIKKIDSENLTKYYNVMEEIFKNESKDPIINSIKYKHSLLKEKEVKEKSIIIHI